MISTAALSTGVYGIEDSRASLLVPLFFGIGGLGALNDHKEEYAEEELALYRALRGTKSPNVRALLHNFPYIIVNREGGLVGKKLNPKIGFLPIGRRRIPTKKRPEKIPRDRIPKRA